MRITVTDLMNDGMEHIDSEYKLKNALIVIRLHTTKSISDNRMKEILNKIIEDNEF